MMVCVCVCVCACMCVCVCECVCVRACACMMVKGWQLQHSGALCCAVLNPGKSMDSLKVRVSVGCVAD